MFSSNIAVNNIITGLLFLQKRPLSLAGQRAWHSDPPDIPIQNAFAFRSAAPSSPPAHSGFPSFLLPAYRSSVLFSPQAKRRLFTSVFLFQHMGHRTPLFIAEGAAHFPQVVFLFHFCPEFDLELILRRQPLTGDFETGVVLKKGTYGPCSSRCVCHPPPPSAIALLLSTASACPAHDTLQGRNQDPAPKGTLSPTNTSHCFCCGTCNFPPSNM